MDDLCENEALFHVTSFANMASIARKGLTPRTGAGLFSHGGYDTHSQGKIFLGCGADAALAWYGLVQDQLWDQFQDDDEPDALVPVMIMVLLDSPEDVFLDEVGDRDVPGSVYVTKTVSTDEMLFWSPADADWMPLSAWDEQDPYSGVSEIEYYDQDGEPVDESDDWHARGFTIFGPYDQGGFKPDHEDVAAWERMPL